MSTLRADFAESAQRPVEVVGGKSSGNPFQKGRRQTKS